jgi:hypothetical protein
MSTFLKFLPLLLTLINAIATNISPTISTFWSHHPDLAINIMSVWASIKLFLPSPIASKTPGV